MSLVACKLFHSRTTLRLDESSISSITVKMFETVCYTTKANPGGIPVTDLKN